MKPAAAMHIGTVHVIKALYYISKVFGLAPFKLTGNCVTKGVLFNTKLRDNLLNNFWFILILSLIILGTVMDIRVNPNFFLNKEVLVGELSTVVLCFSSLVSLITVNMKRGLVARLVRKVSEVDEELLKHENQGMELKRIKYMAVTKICILIISATICMPVSVVSWGAVKGYLQEILQCIPYFVSIIVLVHLLGFMSYVHHRLAMLNSVIASTLKEERRGILTPNPIKDTFRRSFRRANGLRMYPRAEKLYTSSQIKTISVLNCSYSEISQCGAPVSRHSYSLDITYVRQAYNSVYEFLGSVSSIYGFPTLTLLTHNFMVLFGLCYVFIDLFDTGDSLNTLVSLLSNYHKFYMRIAVALRLVTSLLMQVFLTVACNNVTNESKKLSDNVQKLLLHQSLTADDLYQLQLFSFQLQSCKMEFSAGGFFTVNLSYLYSSISAVITYIVVMVQMKQLNKNVQS
jgi:hypothetical protein